MSADCKKQQKETSHQCYRQQTTNFQSSKLHFRNATLNTSRTSCDMSSTWCPQEQIVRRLRATRKRTKNWKFLFLHNRSGRYACRFPGTTKKKQVPKAQESTTIVPNAPNYIFSIRIFQSFANLACHLFHLLPLPRTNSSTTPGSNKETNKQLRLPFVV